MGLFTPHKKKLSVLFVLKARTSDWGQGAYTHKASGLFNSANFVNHMLKDEGFDSHLVEVVDGNSIDRVATEHNADIVILEAIWVTPAKVRELTSLWRHRNRKWIIRNHSELPFLAMEGISLEWLIEYSGIKNTYISCNSPVANHEVALLANLHTNVDKDRVLYLPNYFPVSPINYETPKHHKHHLDISCFGAIRPLKNHIEQAVAAIMYAKKVGKPLKFHINATRLEGRGEPVLKSIRALFKNIEGFELVEHGWLCREEFLALCSKMDVGLQVSFSETFNIVAADHVVNHVPCVTSDEVPWMPDDYHALPVDANHIAEKIEKAIKDGANPQLHALWRYSELSKDIWLETFNRLN